MNTDLYTQKQLRCLQVKRIRKSERPVVVVVVVCLWAPSERETTVQVKLAGSLPLACAYLVSPTMQPVTQVVAVTCSHARWTEQLRCWSISLHNALCGGQRVVAILIEGQFLEILSNATNCRRRRDCSVSCD